MRKRFSRKILSFILASIFIFIPSAYLIYALDTINITPLSPIVLFLSPFVYSLYIIFYAFIVRKMFFKLKRRLVRRALIKKVALNIINSVIAFMLFIFLIAFPWAHGTITGLLSFSFLIMIIGFIIYKSKKRRFLIRYILLPGLLFLAFFVIYLALTHKIVYQIKHFGVDSNIIIY